MSATRREMWKDESSELPLSQFTFGRHLSNSLEQRIKSENITHSKYSLIPFAKRVDITGHKRNLLNRIYDYDYEYGYWITTRTSSLNFRANL